METYDLIAEVLPEIEEAYKVTVCGYQTGLFDEGIPPFDAKLRWAEPVEVWLPIPKNVLEDSTDSLEAMCRQLASREVIQSARFVDDDDLPDNISEMMAGQDLTFLHVTCVPFKDLKVC